MVRSEALVSSYERRYDNRQPHITGHTMNTTKRLLSAAFLFTLAFQAAAAPPELPKGAKARLGSTLFRDTSGWANATLSADGKFLVLQNPRGIQKFDLATGDATPHPAEKNNTFGRQLRFSDAGGRALSVNYADVSVWDATTGKTLATVKRPLPFGDHTASLSKDGRFVAVGGSQSFNMKDKPVTAVVWDVEKNERVAEVPVVQNQDVQVSLSPDGKRLVTWGRHLERNPPKDGVDPANDPNRLLQIWDVPAGKELARLTTDGYQPALAFSPDGDTLALSAGAGTIRLLDPKTGTEKRRLFGRSDQGTRIAYSPGGKTLATAGADGTIQLWNAENGQRISTHPFPLGTASLAVRGIQFTSEDRAVAWTTVASTAMAWDVQAGTMLVPVEGHVAGVRSIAFRTPNEIVTGGDDGQVFVWGSDGKPPRDIKLKNPGSFSALSRFPMVQVHVAADGRTAIAQLLQQGIFELKDGNQVAAPQIGVGLNMRSYLCSDAKTFLSLPFLPYPPNPQPASVKIAVWDVESGTRICELESAPCELQNATFTPDRSKIVTVTVTRDEKKSDWHITAWDLKTGKKLGAYTEVGGFGPTYLACGDNDTVLTSTPGGKLLTLNLADGKTVREIDTGRRNITCNPAFTADGKTFAVSLSGGTGAAEILLFDAKGEPNGKFRGHTGAVQCLAFSADSATLASGSADTTAILWDANAAEK
jgi:WD40 repeat protein